MSQHTDKMLLEKVEQTRARLLFASEENGRQALGDLENHLPADIRLGRKLAEIKQDTKETWDPTYIERALRDLGQEIVNGKTSSNWNKALQEALANPEQSARLLGVSLSTIDGWKNGRNPSAHNKKKLVLLSEITAACGSNWPEPQGKMLAEWRQGPAPKELLDFSKAVT